MAARLLSDPLPLRSTTELAQYREARAIPWVYGRVALTPIVIDEAGLEYLIADHPIVSVDRVVVGGIDIDGWQLAHRLDATGHPLAVLRLTQAPKDGAAVAVHLTGKPHAETGAALTHPAEIAADLLTACGWALAGDEFEALLDDYPDLALGGVLDQAGTLRAAIATLMDGIGATWSAAPLAARRLGAGQPIGRIDQRTADAAEATARHDTLATRLRVTYAHDWSSGQPRNAMTLAAPDVEEEIGRLGADLALPWVRTHRDALTLGTAALQRRARPQWSISVTEESAGQGWQPGDTLTLAHPWLPAGEAVITALDDDTEARRLTVQLMLSAGDVPHVELLARSAAIDPTAADAITVVYRDGTATFTITDESGNPLAGAAVTLDGDVTRNTDRFGQVQFKTARGAHTLTVVAAGYAPFELHVTL